MFYSHLAFNSGLVKCVECFGTVGLFSGGYRGDDYEISSGGVFQN